MKFSQFGDYAAEYAARAVREGAAVVVEVSERHEEGFAFFGGNGGGLTKVRTAKVRTTAPFFPNPVHWPQHVVEEGQEGFCPAEWVE